MSLQFKAKDLSLTGRLIIASSCLICFAAWFSLGLLFKYHKSVTQRGTAATYAHESISLGIQARDLLSEIGRKAAVGTWSASDFERFQNLVNVLDSKGSSQDSQLIIKKIKRDFSSYSKALNSYNSRSENYFNHPEILAFYKKVSEGINELVIFNENLIFTLTQVILRQQERTMQVDIGLLLGFMIVVLFASFRVISFITQPLSKLVGILDNLNVESELPISLPQVNHHIPEVARLSRSFESLFQRLRGYRLLNVRRLLIEKRRADIIAASISDGVFLLRGEEILYKNSIAEKILEIPGECSSKGLRVKGQALGVNTSGMAAVMKAVTHTLPVEFCIEIDKKKLYYLLQSFPISYDLIEEVEHSFGNEVEEVLDRFQANTLVLAQDVTLVREGQEAKSHFLATLSHEIKTPVTSLTMATRLLKKTVDQIPNLTQQTLIKTCADDVDRLRGLLENLLTVSSFDSLTQHLEIQKIDLGKLLVHSVQSFHPAAKERGIELTYQVVHHGSPIMVAMDATKVAWALSNLITNALRHTPRGGKVQVVVKAYLAYAEIKVVDTGPGIERHRQDRIFDKFSSYYDLRVGRSGSIGAGLAVAREIVVAHGGRIWLESEAGHGAEFSFTLPLNRKASDVPIDLIEQPDQRVKMEVNSHGGELKVKKGHS